jgi:hypothetical protein
VQEVNRTSEPRYVEADGRRVRCNMYDPESGYVHDSANASLGTMR